MNSHDAKTIAIHLQGLHHRNNCGRFRHELQRFGLGWLIDNTDLGDIDQTTEVLADSNYINMAWWNGMFDWLRTHGMY